MSVISMQWRTQNENPGGAKAAGAWRGSDGAAGLGRRAERQGWDAKAVGDTPRRREQGGGAAVRPVGWRAERRGRLSGVAEQAGCGGVGRYRVGEWRRRLSGAAAGGRVVGSGRRGQRAGC